MYIEEQLWALCLLGPLLQGWDLVYVISLMSYRYLWIQRNIMLVSHSLSVFLHTSWWLNISLHELLEELIVVRRGGSGTFWIEPNTCNSHETCSNRSHFDVHLQGIVLKLLSLSMYYVQWAWHLLYKMDSCSVFHWTKPMHITHTEQSYNSTPT